MKYYGWEVVRLFISSTFRDFHAERDYLVKYVFPLVREWCLPWRLNVVELDLRWGVTEAEAENGKVLELCLKGIDQSRPFFICLLGERYGWIPNSEDIDTETTILYPDVLNNLDHSVTHLEVLHAVLNPLNPKTAPVPHALFYFRDGESMDKAKDYSYWSDAEKNTFDSTFFDEENKDKAEALKNDIRAKVDPNHTSTYHPQFDPELDNPEDKELKGRITKESLKEFGKKVAEDIISILETEYADRITALKESKDDYSLNNIIANELGFHDSFALNRTKFFVGRRDIIHSLGEYINGNNRKILGLFGGTGSGKSTLLAHFYRLLVYHGYSEFYGYEENAFADLDITVAHFVGASRQSTSLYDTLARLVLSIDSEATIPVDLYLLQQTFLQVLEQSSSTILIILDAINQMEETGDAHSLWWLPKTLPHNVKIIVSTLEGQCADALRTIGVESLDVGPLNKDEQQKMVRELPSVYAKTLDDELVDKIISKKTAVNPLYLQAAIGELRVFGSFELLPQYIENLPDDQIELFEFMLDRIELENEKSKSAIKRLFCSLACARQGLTEKEINTMMFAEGEEDQYLVVLRQMRDYLLERGDTIGYFHDTLGTAVKKKYHIEGNDEKVFHSGMADFFEAMPWFDAGVPSRRKCYELAYHYFKAGRQEELSSLVCDYDWMNATLLSLGVQEIFKTFDWIERENFSPDIKLLSNFFRLSSFSLLKEPRQLASQIWGRLDKNFSPIMEAILQKAEMSMSALWLRPMSTCLIHPDGALISELGGSLARISAVALSQDGAKAYALSNDDTLYIWDTDTAAILRSLGGFPFSSHHGYQYDTMKHHLMISADATMAAINDRHIANEPSYVFWDLKNERRVSYSSIKEEYEKLLKVYDGNAEEASPKFYKGDFCLSPDGKILMNISSESFRYPGGKVRTERIIRIFDLENDVMINRINLEAKLREKGIYDLKQHLDPSVFDGEYAAIGSDKAVEIILNTRSGEIEGTIEMAKGIQNRFACVSSLGLIVRLEGNKMHLHNLQGEFLETLAEYGAKFAEICYSVSPSGEMAVCLPSVIEVWNLAERKLMRKVATKLGSQLAVALSSDGRYAITGDLGSMVHVWDTNINEETDEDAKFYRIRYLLPISDDIVAALSDKDITVWDVRQQRLLHKASVETFFRGLKGTTNSIRAIGLTADGEKIIGHDVVRHRYIAADIEKREQSAKLHGKNNPIFLFDLKKGRLKKGLSVKKLKKNDQLIALPPQNSTVENIVKAVQDNPELSEYTMLYDLLISPDESFFITVLGNFYHDKHQDIRLWDMKTMAPIRKLEGHTMRVEASELSPCGKYAYTASADKSLCVWRLSDGVCIYRFYHDQPLERVAVTPDGSTMIASDRMGKILFLKIENMQPTDVH